MLLIPVIDFDETEAERVDEEKGNRRQDLTTDGLGKGFPGEASPWSIPTGTGGPKARPQFLLEGRRLRVTTAQSGASEKFYCCDKRAIQSKLRFLDRPRKS